LVDLKSSGEYYMEHFHASGGVPRLLREVRGLRDLSAPTITGKSLGEALDELADVPEQRVIRTRANPVSRGGSIAVLRGNIIPGSAIIKQSAASPHLLNHTGRAVVFDSVDDLTRRIDDESLDVEPTDILVLRNAGPRGGPGMPEAGYISVPRKLARRGVKDMVRISDARMSGTAFGTIVLLAVPEAYVGGPIAQIRNGDMIRLDVEHRRLDLLVSDDELARRRTTWHPPPVHKDAERGYKNLYLRSVL
jgi:dihydroxy-acid dehydratase